MDGPLREGFWRASPFQHKQVTHNINPLSQAQPVRSATVQLMLRHVLRFVLTLELTIPSPIQFGYG